MTKLTTERLEHYSALPTQPAEGDGCFKKGIFMYEVRRMARQLLAYEQAAKNPIGSFHISDGKVEATTDYCRDGEWPVQDGEVLVYAAPVLPKQPELENKIAQIKRQKALAWLKRVAYENPCMKEVKTCIEVLSAPAQPVVPEQPEPTISFYRDGIIAAAKWVENQRDAYDNEHGQSDPDTGAFEFGNDAQLEYSTTLSEIAEGIRSLHPASAQPVSEPYKLPSGYALVPCKLTAENGAKSCMIGEFTEQTEISCPECFGDDECETCDGSGMIEVTVPVSWTTIKDIWAKGIEHFAAAPAQESE
ncbi:hypothetical protein [Hafnia alvei]|uniref:Molecular chaperone DnaJ n=2 Tax=Hafnia alvei TaxID=569 RepID=A0A377PM14_HAFAL|nr:hypothetical protein [Hafnia alvei]KFC86064.1 Eaa family phage protein [Hafnia alvei ATCC 13337]WQD24162.1 hypothetical protein U0008_15250 [Hafnia alvei]STQ81357.1 Uncharacterised protein [Hafnia alvei]